MNNNEVRVAVSQIEPIYLDTPKTIEKIIYFINEASKENAKIIVFPELILSGYPNWINLNDPKIVKESMSHWNKYITSSISINDDLIKKLCSCAKSNDINVVIGFIEKDDLYEEVIYNSSIFINNNGVILGHHRKLTPVKNELLFFKKGNASDIKVFESNLGRVGIGICAEHFNSLFKYSLALLGEKIHCALWVNHEKLKHVVDATARAISIENGVFTLLSCQTSTKIDNNNKCELNFIGGSGILSPWGEYIAGPIYYDETILYANIDFNITRNISATYKTMGRDNREDIFDLRLKR